MMHEKKRRMTGTFIRTAVAIVLLLLYAQRLFADEPGAASRDVDLGPVIVAPARLSPGQFPNIEARVDLAPSRSGKDVVVRIIAVITQPDHRTKSWSWQKVRVSRSTPRTVTIPKEYDTSTVGTYRVEIVVYSGDMNHRIVSRLGQFEAVDRRSMEKTGRAGPSGGREGAIGETAKQEPKRSSVGLGIYGNALNPAAGGTLFLWPSRYVGVQGLISFGKFTSYEGRLLVKTEWSPGYALYGGVGYLHVRTEKDVIGVATRFDDGGPSGVVGLEVGLGETAALKPGGAMLVSLKYGQGSAHDSSRRFFQYYNEQNVEDLFNNDPRLELAKQFKSSSHAAGEAKAVDWLNLILKRRTYND